MPRGRWVVYAEVKRQVPIERVLERIGHPFRRKPGGRIEAACPLHEGANPRHFRVSSNGRAFKCFGCNAGGNVLDLVAGLESVSIREAALLLVDWFDLRRTAATARSANPSAPAGTPRARKASATDASTQS